MGLPPAQISFNEQFTASTHQEQIFLKDQNAFE
jgi:hypothetical protein